MISRLVDLIRQYLYSESDPLDQIEDAIDELDEDLDEIKQAIADVTTQKKKLEIQCNRTEQKRDEKIQKSKSLISNGQESDAEFYIKRKISFDNQIDSINSQIDELTEIQNNLIKKKDDIQNHINDLKIKKSSIETKKQSAEAEIQAMETLSEYDDNYEIEKNMDELMKRTNSLRSQADIEYDFDEDISEENINKELEKITD